MRLSLISLTLMIFLSIAYGISSYTNKNQQVHSDKNFPFEVTKEREIPIPGLGGVIAITWSPDGSQIAAASSNGTKLTVWDRKGNKIAEITRKGIPLYNGALQFLNGSSELLYNTIQSSSKDIEKSISSSSLNIWSINSGKVVGQINGRYVPSYFQTSKDQRYVVVSRSTKYDNMIIYQKDADKPTIVSIDGGIFSFNNSLNTSKIAIGGRNGRIFIVDRENGQIERSFFAYTDPSFGISFINAVAIDPDALYVAASENILHLDQSEQAPEKEPSSNRNIEPIRVFHIQSGSEIAALPAGSASSIKSIYWSPNQNYIAFINQSQYISFWCPFIEKGPFLSLKLDSIPFSLSISPDSQQVAVATSTGIVLISVNKLTKGLQK